MAGTLFVVATPIGNLEDLTFRALRTLREVDLIAAEDTRRTARLLARYEVRKPLVSLREHNEARETPRLLARIAGGESIALVSDAGTPGIADPGARLVRAARSAGVTVVPIPGPSAVTAALSASGLDSSEFVFMGFPPSSGTARDDWFSRLAAEARPVVFFEAPHRIRKTLRTAVELVKRPIIIFREISKKHEISVECNNIGDTEEIRNQGEFAVVVSGAKAERAVPLDGKDIHSMFLRLTERADLDESLAIDLTARVFDSNARAVRKIIKKQSILVKQQNTKPA